MLPTRLLVPTFTQMLRGLTAWLDKGAAHEEEAGRPADGLLAARIAPDMHPLAAQIRFACVQAWEAVHRLRGEALPQSLEALRAEGWNAGEQPGSMTYARARIAETIAFLEALGPGDLDDGAGRPIALDLPNGIAFDLNGEAFARDWALPQFYFHLAMAYAILRNQGVALGKADYAAHMLAYLRPGTMPAA
jgi:hypothetical protein